MKRERRGGERHTEIDRGGERKRERETERERGTPVFWTRGLSKNMRGLVFPYMPLPGSCDAAGHFVESAPNALD